MTDLRESLRGRWTEFTERWPTIQPQEAPFLAHLAALSITDLQDLHWTDLALASCCAQQDPAALRIFETEFVAPTGRAIRRLDPSTDFVDEVQQRLRTRLLLADGEHSPRITAYGGRGPLGGWVSVAAVRLGLTLLGQTKRAAQRDALLWSDAVLFPGGVPAELQHLKQRYAPRLAECLRAACGQLEDRERAVLRMYFVEGLNIDKIGRVYGVHRATIARWIARTRTTLCQQTHAMMLAEGVAPAEELQSIDRLVRSQLDISLGGLLGS